LQTNTTADLFRTFEVGVRSVLDKSKDKRAIVDGVRPLLAKLLAEREIVPDQYRQPLPNKYAQYLLYKPADGAFVVIAFIWGPSQASPVHDHQVWGLVGQMEGSVQERRYRRLDDGSNPDRADLQLIDTVVCHPGEIGFVYPPAADIHDVSNPFNEVAITIHVYGADIGQQERFLYETETGAVRHIITRHLNSEPIWPS